MSAWLGLAISIGALPAMLVAALVIEAIFKSGPRHFYLREQAARRSGKTLIPPGDRR